MSTAGRVGQLTGYAGYIPSRGLQYLEVKTGMTSHVPPAERITPAQPRAPIDPLSVDGAAPQELPPNPVLPRASGSTYSSGFTPYASPANQMARTLNRGPVPGAPRGSQADDQVLAPGHTPAAVQKSQYAQEFANKTLQVLQDKQATREYAQQLQEQRRPTQPQLVFPEPPLPSADSLSSLSASAQIPAKPVISQHSAAASDMMSTYQREFGVYGSDPRSNSATVMREVTLRATNRDLAEGTSKSTSFNVSYAGHVPLNPINRAAMNGEDDDLRKHSKDNLLLSSLVRMPKSGLFVPRSTPNDLGHYEPDGSQQKMTTTGLYGKIRPEDSHCAPERSEHFVQNAMVRTFFTPNAECNPADGIPAAERFFGDRRPMEGRPLLGDPNQRRWIADKDLKKTAMFLSSA